MTRLETTEERAEAAGLNARSVRSDLTQDEVQAMVKATPEPRDKAAIILVCGIGLRVSELVNLQWDDVIDDAENPIKLQVTGTESPTRQVLVERGLWSEYVAPLFFASLEGGAAGCTSTPAVPHIFPVLPHEIHQTLKQAAVRADIE